jgi:hypothetical protein
MLISRRPLPTFGLLAASLSLVVACSGGDPDIVPVDGPAGCDPATALPSNYRPIPSVSTGMVTMSASSGDFLIDATAGGSMVYGDNPYIYVDLKTGTKVDINDIDARMSTAWDIALKRSSLRINGGDSGTGGRKLAIVPGTDLAAVTAPPTSGYTVDDFADDDCTPIQLPAGEPSSAFGFWYNYVRIDPMDPESRNIVVPKDEIYVLERPDGSHTALKLKSYYDPMVPMMTRGAVYTVEWKQL